MWGIAFGERFALGVSAMNAALRRPLSHAQVEADDRRARQCFGIDVARM
jgi:hypothetical protein